MSTFLPDLAAGLTRDEAAGLLALGSVVTLTRGETLFRLGTAADTVYLVVRGRVALTLPMQIRDGQEDVLVEEKQAGETLGWSGLVPPHRFTLNASAAAETEVLALTRDALLAHFEAHPAVGYAVTKNVAAVIGHRLQVFQTMWLREMQRTVEQRYA
jgi:CRP/FNR family cyclic AMP-dependent transcriptional regulator